MSKKVRPIDATFDELCGIPRDNDETEGFWWQLDGETLAITQQRDGQQAEAAIVMPIADAREMVKFLTTPYTTTSATREDANSA